MLPTCGTLPAGTWSIFDGGDTATKAVSGYLMGIEGEFLPSGPFKAPDFSVPAPLRFPPAPDNKHSSDRQQKAGRRPCAILVTHTPLLRASWTKKLSGPENGTRGNNFGRKYAGKTRGFRDTYRCFLLSSSKTGGRREGMVVQPSWLRSRLAARC